MNDIGFFVHHHSSTSFLCQVFKTILGIHVFLRKIAVLVFKTRVIHGQQLTEDLTLNLLYKIVKGVPINETALFGVVPMQIKVK